MSESTIKFVESGSFLSQSLSDATEDGKPANMTAAVITLGGKPYTTKNYTYGLINLQAAENQNIEGNASVVYMSLNLNALGKIAKLTKEELFTKFKAGTDVSVEYTIQKGDETLTSKINVEGFKIDGSADSARNSREGWYSGMAVSADIQGIDQAVLKVTTAVEAG
jgi:hypothetical protein